MFVTSFLFFVIYYFLNVNLNIVKQLEKYHFPFLPFPFFPLSSCSLLLTTLLLGFFSFGEDFEPLEKNPRDFEVLTGVGSGVPLVESFLPLDVSSCWGVRGVPIIALRLSSSLSTCLKDTNVKKRKEKKKETLTVVERFGSLVGKLTGGSDVLHPTFLLFNG